MLYFSGSLGWRHGNYGKHASMGIPLYDPIPKHSEERFGGNSCCLRHRATAFGQRSAEYALYRCCTERGSAKGQCSTASQCQMLNERYHLILNIRIDHTKEVPLIFPSFKGKIAIWDRFCRHTFLPGLFSNFAELQNLEERLTSHDSIA